MAFYGEMAAMAADLLKPDSAGGLGQGAITIVRQSPDVPDPLRPYDPVGMSETLDVVDQIGNPKAEYVSQGIVVQTDTAYMIVPPKLFAVAVGDRVRIAGQDVGGIVHVERLGSLDVPVYNVVYVNR